MELNKFNVWLFVLSYFSRKPRAIYSSTLVIIVILLLLHRRLFRYFRRNSLPRSSKNLINRSVTEISVSEGVCIKPVPTEKNIKTDVDIIAIHGLDTRSPGTWTFKTEGKPDVNWLSDETMLPRDVGSARIFTCDWPSDLFERSGYRQKTFDEFAGLLFTKLAEHHSRDKERPILFIASCFGGILLLKALVDHTPQNHSLRSAVRGIVFLATPFSGTSFRDIAEWAVPGLRAWAFIRAEKLSNLLYETELHRELAQLRSGFTAFCYDIDLPREHLAAFYELGESSLTRKVIPWLPDLFAQKKPLVDQDSATLDIIETPLPLDRIHLLMNKFYCPKDDDYQLVAGRVRNILQKIREGRPVEAAYAYISDKCYNDENLKIERISGDRLLVEKCYVNLVVIKHLDQKEKNSQSSQFSLHSRLKIETPDISMQVDMRHLFDQREVGTGKTIQHKRILIRGHAGVGKTTLCKKIVHDFKNHGMWRNMFVRILWLPLRNLKKLGKTNCNLEAILREEYFSQTTKGQKFARDLCQNLEANQYRETLFILDGLDEVYEGLDRESYMFKLLRTLLDLPTVIVTSRPHASLPPELRFDLELETIGFYPEQVKSYMESVLTDRQKIGSLQSLLQQHQLLQGLVRIPIQLDALCYIWSGNDSSLPKGSILRTMTSIYQVIVEKLWKKDIITLEKENNRRVIVSTDIRHISLRTIETYVHDELYFLERLAFTGMVNDAISFTISDLRGIPSDENSQFLFDKTLPRLSFLRTSNSSFKDPTYHFLHLTFQEYFAARYFVRRWKAGDPFLLKNKPSNKVSMRTFLGVHKYESRYDIFWRFVAGLLSLEDEGEDKNEDKGVGRFFDLIEDEPLDLIGFVHQRLIMHCLSEVPLEKKDFFAKRKNLENQLGRWLVFECKLMEQSRLAREVEFPAASLSRVLETASVGAKTKSLLFKSLQFHPAIPPQVIHLACSLLRENSNMKLKDSIIDMLIEQQSALDDEILGAIVACLEDKDESVQNIAASAPKRLDALRTRDDILYAAVKFLGKKQSVRLPAISLLKGQSQLSDKTVNALVTNLPDETQLGDEAARSKFRNRDIAQCDAIEILILQPQPNEVILQVITTQLRNPDELIRDTAVHFLKPYLSDDIVRTITPFLKKERIISYDWEAVFELLGAWPQCNDEVLEIICAQLKGHDKYNQVSGIRALRKWPKISFEILNIVRARLEDHDKDIQKSTTEALGGWPKLDDQILELVAANLNDEDRDVRYKAVSTLALQPKLNHKILEAIKARAQDEDENLSVREIAIKRLMDQKQLGDNIYDMVTTLLQGEKVTRCCVLGPLERWPKPSNEIVDIVAAQLEEDSGESRVVLDNKIAAIRALANWSPLSDPVLEAIAVQLNDSNADVQSTAASAFRKQPQPNKNILKAISARLKGLPLRPRCRRTRRSLRCLLLDHPYLSYEDSDRKTLRALLYALENWPQLDDDVLYIVAELLAFKGDEEVNTAILIFRAQSQPNDKLINAIAKHLENPSHRVRLAAILAMANWSRLSDEFIIAIAACLAIRPEDEDEDVPRAAFDTLTNQRRLPFAVVKPHVQFIYQCLLQKSFKRHVYWLTENGESFIVIGARKVQLDMTKDDADSLHARVAAWHEKMELKTQAP
ncbi:armadillo-type protein [Xylaria cubensis]|nr:armadillo-type protein [Xylaria cubensis]